MTDGRGEQEMKSGDEVGVRICSMFSVDWQDKKV